MQYETTAHNIYICVDGQSSSNEEKVDGNVTADNSLAGIF